MTGGGDSDEFADIPATDFDDTTVQDQEDAVEGWTAPADLKLDAGDDDLTAGASEVGGRAGEP